MNEGTPHTVCSATLSALHCTKMMNVALKHSYVVAHAE